MKNPIISEGVATFCVFFLPLVEDFLIHDLYVLAAFAEHQPESEKLKQVNHLSR